MYAACGIMWRVVADHDRMELEMKRLRGSISKREAGSRDYRIKE
jgi:hypothetical protein